MLPFQTILVPTDFSDDALSAAELAMDVADRFKSKVILLHVMHFPVSSVTEDAMTIIERNNAMRAESYQSLNAISDILRRHFPNASLQLEVRLGFLLEETVRIVNDLNVDLVVMGTKGASGIKAATLGSNTSRIMENLSVPVIAIPHEMSLQPFKKIIFTTDLEFEDVDAIENVVRFAKVYDAALEVVHFTHHKQYKIAEDSLEWFQEICESRVQYQKISFKAIQAEAGVLNQIRSTIENSNADLICLSSVKKSFIKRLMQDSITRKLIFNSPVAVMVFHIHVSNKI